jgi:hypothetical protein
MATRRKEEDETAEQQLDRTTKTTISNHATRSEKTAWLRKRNNLETFVENDIRPIEQQIEDLRNELTPLYDKVADMRKEMVATCIHPYDELRSISTDKVQCTFCNKILSISFQAD